MTKVLGRESTCSIARSIDAVGDPWTLLIVREAIVTGATRFREFRDALGVAPNILSKRLATLVDDGLMERRTYREAGARARDEYVLTDAGRSLSLVIAALGEWGRTQRPRPDGTSPRFTSEQSGVPARLAFVTDAGEVVDPAQLLGRRTEDALDPAP